MGVNHANVAVSSGISGVEVNRVTAEEGRRILTLQESHFLDFKSRNISPARLSHTLSAFANSAGGEVFVGVEEGAPFTWNGFPRLEDANGHIQVVQQIFPLLNDVMVEFIQGDTYPGYLLHVTVRKTGDVRFATNQLAYVRLSAQNQVVQGEALERLKFAKGAVSFEDQLVGRASVADLATSKVTRDFMAQVVPRADAAQWLVKQRLVRDATPTVAGVLLFTDEPQAILPKRCGIKIYRHKTSEQEGTRETLASPPVTIEGCIYDQIKSALQHTVSTIQSINVLGPSGFERVKYPEQALHEIITNAVLHRDYSIPDDIDVRIFDNRIEVESPGPLPGHITLDNILSEQYARNPAVVRLVNKFPDPPNKDVGEGLNTAFAAMRRLSLKPPEIEERRSSVIVYLRHEPLASHEELIMEYLESHDSISNSKARQLCHVGSESVMQKVFRGMIQRGMIEPVPGKRGRAASYRRRPPPGHAGPEGAA